jgi:hypothetical protein
MLLLATIDGGRDDPFEQFGHRCGKRLAKIAPAATKELQGGRTAMMIEPRCACRNGRTKARNARLRAAGLNAPIT